MSSFNNDALKHWRAKIKKIQKFFFTVMLAFMTDLPCTCCTYSNCIYSFKVIPTTFQASQNHLGEHCTYEVSLKEIMHYLSVLIYRPNLLIRLLTVKIQIYRPVWIWRPIYCASLKFKTFTFINKCDQNIKMVMSI